MTQHVVFTVAVEGIVDAAVARRMVEHVGAGFGAVYGQRGKPHLRGRIEGYNTAARHAPWLVLIDLDREATCIAPVLANWIPSPAHLLCFRVAVQEVEAWLLSDRQGASSFLGVPISKIPESPENMPHPKRLLVELARQSKKRDIRQDLVPNHGSGRTVGPAYTARLAEFARTRWQPDQAAARAQSLSRAIRCLELLALRAGNQFA